RRAPGASRSSSPLRLPRVWSASSLSLRYSPFGWMRGCCCGFALPSPSWGTFCQRWFLLGFQVFSTPDGYVENNPPIVGRKGSPGEGWWGSWGEDAELLSARVVKSLPQSRDCKIKEGAQLQRHRALAGVDNADRHR